MAVFEINEEPEVIRLNGQDYPVELSLDAMQAVQGFGKEDDQSLAGAARVVQTLVPTLPTDLSGPTTLRIMGHLAEVIKRLMGNTGDLLPFPSTGTPNASAGPSGAPNDLAEVLSVPSNVRDLHD